MRISKEMLKFGQDGGRRSCTAAERVWAKNQAGLRYLASMTDYLTLDDVRGLHADVMRRTGFLPAPVRILGALESAFMRPQMVAHCEGADLLTQAVTLLAILQAQGFMDGNKRTAMFAALVFLELNGSTFDGDDELLAVLLEEAASCPHDEARTTIAEWMPLQIVTQRDERDRPRL
jgi:death on curing protein